MTSGLYLSSAEQRFLRLGRVRVNDFVPDEILLRFGRKMLDVLVHQHELRQRRHVEARARLVERADDGRFGVGLDGKIALHLGQMLFELGVILCG